MKLSSIFAATVLTVVLAGCGESTPPAKPASVESASEAARNDDRAIALRLAEQKAAVETAFRKEQEQAERRRLNEAFDTMNRRWVEGLNEASRTGRSDMAELIKKLESIKSEAEALATNECTDRARATLVSSMAAAIESFRMFTKETGESSAATQLQLQKSAALLRDAALEFSSCK